MHKVRAYIWLTLALGLILGLLIAQEEETGAREPARQEKSQLIDGGSFETRWDLALWDPIGETRIRRSDEYVTHGKFSLKMVAEGGIILRAFRAPEAITEWSKYSELRLDVYNADVEDVILTLAVEGGRMRKEFGRLVRGESATTVRLPVSVMARWVDVTYVSHFSIMASGGYTLYLDNIRLVK